MATVPGITTIATDTPGASGQQQAQRLQVSDNSIPQAPALRPQAAPTNTFKGVAAFSDPNLQRLADSLGTLAPQIYRYGDIQQAQQQNTNARDQLYAALAGKTPDEQGAIIQSDPRFQTHFAQQFGHSLMGQAIGEQSATAATQNYNTQFDKVNGNFDAWANQTMQTTLAGIKDPVAQAAAARRLQTTFDSLRQQQGQFSTQQQQVDQSQLMKGGFSSLVGQSIDGNADPAQALSAIRQQMTTTNAVYARMTPPQQNQALVGALGDRLESMKDDPNYAKTYNMVKGILSAPFKDASGQEHSLLGDATVGGAAHDVLAKANTLYWQRDEQDNSDAISKLYELAKNGDPDYQTYRDQMLKQFPRYEGAHQLVRSNDIYSNALHQKVVAQQQQTAVQAEQSTLNNIRNGVGMDAILQGQAHALVDQYYRVVDPATGKQMMDPKTGQPMEGVYTADKLRQDAVDTRQDQLERRFANDPDGLFNAMVDLYSSNGLVQKQWAEQIKSGPIAAGNMTTAGASFPRSLTQGLALYRKLQAISPTLLAAHSDQKSNDFYGVASTAMDSLGMDQQQALQLATRATTDPSFGKAMPDTDKRANMELVKNQLGTMIKLPWSYDLASVNNRDEVASKVVEAADVIHRSTGVPMDAAITQAAPQVVANYQIVNGNAVNVIGRSVPPNFGDLATKYLQDFATKNRGFFDRRGIDPSGLSIMNIGQGGNWAIFANGRPIPSTVPGSAFSVSQLVQAQQQIINAQKADALSKVEHRNDPWLVIGDPRTPYSMTLGPAYPQGMTPAQGKAQSDAAVRIYEEQKKAQDELRALHPGDPTLGRAIPGL